MGNTKGGGRGPRGSGAEPSLSVSPERRDELTEDGEGSIRSSSQRRALATAVSGVGEQGGSGAGATTCSLTSAPTLASAVFTAPAESEGQDQRRRAQDNR